MYSRSMPQEIKLIFAWNMQGSPSASFSITAMPPKLTHTLSPGSLQPQKRKIQTPGTTHEKSPDTFKQRETKTWAKKENIN